LENIWRVKPDPEIRCIFADEREQAADHVICLAKALHNHFAPEKSLVSLV